MTQTARGVFLVVVAGVLRAPATADWLQMKDGGRVQTRGAWNVRGAQVVFTLPNGTLAAVRVADVDLAASEQLTAAEKAPPTPPAEPVKREPVAVITDADLPPVPRRPVAAEAAEPAPAAAAQAPAASPGGETAAGSTPGPAVQAGRLEVIDWEARYDAEANTSTVSGTLKNNSAALAHALQLTVTVLDAAGSPLATAEATVNSKGLTPAGSVSFSASFPGVSAVPDARFEPSAQWEELRPPTAAERAAALPPPAPVPTDRLQILEWSSDTTSSAGATVRGQLTNPMATTAEEVVLEVRLVDAGGTVIATGRALLGSTTLAPAQRTNFRVTFLGIREFADVRFETRYRAARGT
jgi:hypothetical protein